MSANERPFIGSIFERKNPNTSTVPSSRLTGTLGTGLPAVQHRSKSAFAWAREEAKGNARVRQNGVPSVIPSQAPRPPLVVDAKPISRGEPPPKRRASLGANLKQIEDQRVTSSSTGLTSQPTHWRRTMFLLRDPILAEEGETLIRSAM
ncbi:hypothetical protein HYDPIDRAFT_118885 [Hydnomerulius pinastri MD-312]|uniref:Uncharacterized protein n=1 Tax=Hydnomerulius pinastri MD-312 TaxID=994086 RepID=A0A0C9W8M9_9AGAM|nr:hypothetical protein HYDPIDRAFT_118885 [Hydnomerulius pinastri MD-312]